jgi:hypothetical protein
MFPSIDKLGVPLIAPPVRYAHSTTPVFAFTAYKFLLEEPKYNVPPAATTGAVAVPPALIVSWIVGDALVGPGNCDTPVW